MHGAHRLDEPANDRKEQIKAQDIAHYPTRHGRLPHVDQAWMPSSMDLQAPSLSSSERSEPLEAVMIAWADQRLSDQPLGEFGEPRRKTGRPVNYRVAQLGEGGLLSRGRTHEEPRHARSCKLPYGPER